MVRYAKVSIPREDSCFWERDSADEKPEQAMFQSPERIHAFGNNGARLSPSDVAGFNPQRGFMLLGTQSQTLSLTKTSFQSPERIHAFGNQKRHEAQHFRRCFNPQRGFMLLGTRRLCIHRAWHGSFQSPERIHAFGNTIACIHCSSATQVSIPREDSCFWERCH